MRGGEERRSKNGKLANYFSRLNRKYVAVYLSVIVLLLLAVAVFSISSQPFNAVINVTPTQVATQAPASQVKPQSAFKYKVSSPHFSSIKDWTLVWSYNNVTLKQLCPDYDQNPTSCEERTAKKAAQTYDYIIGSSKLMNANYNQNGLVYEPHARITSVEVGTDEWNFVLNYASENNVALGDILFDYPYCANVTKTCSFNFFTTAAPPVISKYWSSPQMVSRLKQNGYKGLYWDDGNIGSDQWTAGYASALTMLTDALKPSGLIITINGAPWVNGGSPYAKGLGGEISEHAVFHGYETYAGSNGAMDKAASRVAWYKSNTPNILAFYQGGFYDTCNYFKNYYAPQGTYRLAQRIQMSSLGMYYFILDPDLKMPYRFSGSACLPGNEDVGDQWSWYYNEDGVIPLPALAFDLGQPKGSYSVQSRFNFTALDLDGKAKTFIGQVDRRDFTKGTVLGITPQPYGWRNYDDKGLLAQDAQYFNTLLGSVPFDQDYLVLGFDGSLRGPLRSGKFRQAEVAVLPFSPLVINKFDPMKLGDGTSMSEIDDAAYRSGSKISFKPINVDQLLNGTELLTESADVTLQRKVNDKVTIVVDFGTVNIAAAPKGLYNFDDNSFYSPNSVGFDTAKGNLQPFNVASTVKMQGVDYSHLNPQILKNGRSCNECKIEINVPNSLVFSVPEFNGRTIYSVGIQPTPTPIP